MFFREFYEIFKNTFFIEHVHGCFWLFFPEVVSRGYVLQLSVQQNIHIYFQTYLSSFSSILNSFKFWF